MPSLTELSCQLSVAPHAATAQFTTATGSAARAVDEVAAEPGLAVGTRRPVPRDTRRRVSSSDDIRRPRGSGGVRGWRVVTVSVGVGSLRLPAASAAVTE